MEQESEMNLISFSKAQVEDQPTFGVSPKDLQLPGINSRKNMADLWHIRGMKLH